MIKPDLNDIKNNIVNEDGWGSYFIYDNFLDDKMFRSLCDDFNEIKTSTENIYSNVEPPKVWRENEFSFEKRTNIEISMSCRLQT